MPVDPLLPHQYILFWGAIGLDTLAFFMLVFSDWTFSALRISNNESKLRKKVKSRIASLLSWFLIFKQPKWYECHKHSVEPKHEVPATLFLFRRWSGYVSGHNLIRYCIKGRPNRSSKQIDNANNCFISDEISNVSTTKRPNRIPFLGQIGGKVIHFLGFIRDKIVHCLGLDSMGGVTDFVDEIKYVSHEPLTKELWKFIFVELKKKSGKLDRSSSEPEAAKKISSARGDRILQDKPYRKKLLPYVTEVAYDESLLLWHIATELLYHHEDDHQHISGDDNNHREFSKVLSDYMLYLLVMQPSMMSAVAGIGKIRFRDTCAETKRFLKWKSLKGNPEKEACRKILEVTTHVKPVTVKGDRSKSVLFDASILAKELKEDKWELLSKMWVELLSYAACNCSARTHAQQVSKGGELITFVWLLMAHFGLGDQFQINEGQGKAKLIVNK